MITKKQFLILTTGFITLFANAQSDPIIMKVNGKDITKSEFEYLYKKNNTGILLDEYVELFKNFKLKVSEAETQGIDTTAAFKKELADNREQLAQQYRSQNLVDENMVQKEYSRMNEDREISLLFIQMKDEQDKTMSVPRFLPADTLLAYNKATKLRQRLLKGESFDKIGAEISNDKNNNFTGWISALRMMPTIEDIIYSTEVGKISQPIRINSGYIIIKVSSKRPSKGEIHAAHIMVMCPANADSAKVEEANKKADEIYSRVISGEDFATLAKELSDDKGSGQNGGDLSWFGSGQMVKEFEDAAFSLQKEGDISKPVRSQYGFHIIKLLGTRGIAPIEDVRNNIIGYFNRGEKFMDINKPKFEQLKKDNQFILNETIEKSLYKVSNLNHPSDSVFIASEEKNNENLFSIWEKSYTVADFVSFLKNANSSMFLLSTDFLRERLYTYKTKSMEKEEDAHLEERYPEFKNLMREYRDGFLSYEITQNEVWGKAPKDTTGLTVFFDENKNNYTWEQPRYKGCIILCKDKKVKKEVLKSISGLDINSAVDYLKALYKDKENQPIKIERGLWAPGNNQYVDEAIFKTKKTTENPDFLEYIITGKVLEAPENYTDVGGLVISDYQNYLEQQWIAKLKQKYPIVIYKNVLETVK